MRIFKRAEPPPALGTRAPEEGRRQPFRVELVALIAVAVAGVLVFPAVRDSVLLQQFWVAMCVSIGVTQ